MKRGGGGRSRSPVKKKIRCNWVSSAPHLTWIGKIRYENPLFGLKDAYPHLRPSNPRLLARDAVAGLGPWPRQQPLLRLRLPHPRKAKPLGRDVHRRKTQAQSRDGRRMGRLGRAVQRAGCCLGQHHCTPAEGLDRGARGNIVRGRPHATYQHGNLSSARGAAPLPGRCRPLQGRACSCSWCRNRGRDGSGPPHRRRRCRGVRLGVERVVVEHLPACRVERRALRIAHLLD